MPETKATVSPMPPVAAIDAQTKAMKCRRTCIKSISDLATPELRQWVVANLQQDIEEVSA